VATEMWTAEYTLVPELQPLGRVYVHDLSVVTVLDRGNLPGDVI